MLHAFVPEYVFIIEQAVLARCLYISRQVYVGRHK